MAAKEQPKDTDAARVAARYLDRWERHLSLTATGAGGGEAAPGQAGRPRPEKGREAE